MLNRTPLVGFKRFLHFTQSCRKAYPSLFNCFGAAVICTQELKVQSRLFLSRFFLLKTLSQLFLISTWRHRDSVRAVELLWVHQQHIADLHSLLACKLSVTLLHEADFWRKFWVDGMSRKTKTWNFENVALGFCRPTSFQQRVKLELASRSSLTNWHRWPWSEELNQNFAVKKTNLVTLEENV